MANNLTSQAATMQLNGVPNRIIMNLNPLFIILLIPIMDQFVFMPLRRRRIHFTPTKRITCGFALASCAMISAAVTQHFIYKRSPCGTHASSCAKLPEHPVSVWVQIVPYALLAASEILGTVTILEYAFTKAPRGMRSFVTAIALSMNTISVALSQALIPLAKDPRLVWNYGVVAVLTAGAGVLFWYWSRRVDEHEDFMANMPEGVNPGQRPGVDIELDDRVKTLAIRGSSTGTEAQKITDDV
jgi:POT family proton-dependent oligopeptide transporter